MPNIGFGELLLILLLALVIFGPRKLPQIGRTIGRSLREFRRASSEFRSDLERDVDQEPVTGTKPSAPHAGGGPAERSGDPADEQE